MNKSQLKYYFILGAFLTALISWEYLKPKETEWTVTLDRKDKIPYGTFVFYNMLEDIFPEKDIEKNKKTLFEYNRMNSPENKNFIFVTKKFNADKLEIETMFKMLKAGNNFFISAFEFSKTFADTLDIALYNNLFFGEDTVSINFTNPCISNDSAYIMNKGFEKNHFSYFKEDSIIVLGKRDEKFVNFIKKDIGKGTLFIHCQPMIFTNYHILKDNNSEYVSKVLSHLPVKDVVWEDYGKFENENQNSPLRYIFANSGLYAAYLLLISTLLAYAIFTAKRKQRVIPIIEPLKNTTVEFVDTVGRLYLHGKNHKDIALKKYSYFLDFLRVKYYISIQNFGEQEIKKISEKTGGSEEILNKIFKTAKNIQKASKISDKQLLNFSNDIENFYKEAN